MTVLRAGAATDVGRVRSNNQDNFLVAERLYAVADGMGGHAGGEVASLTAIDALRSSFEHEPDGTADALADAVRRANEAVWEQAHGRRELRGMGTTITAVALVEEDGEQILTIVNVGDSRAYLFRDGSLDQLTDDHSVAEVLRRAGRLSSDEAATHPQRHMLTRVLGEKADVEVDCFRITPYQGDRIALASDGLFNELADEDIASILRAHDDPTEAAEKLVEAALEHGGRDNVTVVVIDVVDDDDRAAKASAALASTPSTMTSADATVGRETNISEPATPPRAPVPRAAATPSPRASTPERAAAPPPVRQTRQGRRVTLRAVTFVLAIVAVLGGAVAATGWFARGGYYVGQEDGEVVIFQGRPGGLLWFSPTIADRTGLDMSDVRASNVRDIEAGKEQSSLDDARRYVRNVTKDEPPEPSIPPVPPPTVTTVFPAPTPSPVTTP